MGNQLRRTAFGCFLTVCLYFCIAAGAGATTYYVDAASGSDANDGQSEAKAFATLNGCINNLRGGDTCLIKNGTYYGPPNSTAYSPYLNFCRDGISGTAAQPTTIKNFPGHRPTICSNAGCTPNAPAPSIGVFSENGGCSYISFQGLHIDGAWTARSGNGIAEDRANHHIELANSELEGGFDCDGNYGMVRLQSVKSAHVHHNHIHAMDPGSCGGRNTAAGIKIFRTWDDLIEYNTIDGGEEAAMVFGIDEKDSIRRAVIRYNKVLNTQEAGIRLNGQTVQPPAQGAQVYGNLIVHDLGDADCNGRDSCAGIRFDYGASDLLVHHNTIVGGAVGGFWYCGGDDCPGDVNTQWRDNIVHQPALNDIFINIAHWKNIGAWKTDYNAYDADRRGSSDVTLYRGGVYGNPHCDANNLASWRNCLSGANCNGAGDGGCEAHSFEAATPCSFVADTGTASGDYHLAGGVCKTADSEGKELGTFGAATCIGSTCDNPLEPPPLFPTPPPTPPPNQPTPALGGNEEISVSGGCHSSGVPLWLALGLLPLLVTRRSRGQR